MSRQSYDMIANGAKVEPEDYEDYFEFGEDCDHCGGEGYTYHCIDGCCLHADEGCDLCTKRCDFCNPLKQPVQP